MNNKLLILADKLYENLLNLRGLQNGPPLIKYEDDWNEAMKTSTEVLNEYEEYRKIT